jgi:hypothetical protein
MSVFIRDMHRQFDWRLNLVIGTLFAVGFCGKPLSTAGLCSHMYRTYLQ